MSDNPMLEHTHSHPAQFKESGTYPSGLPGSRTFGSGDIQMAKDIVKIYGITPTFKIYVPWTKKTITYTTNSIRSDF